MISVIITAGILFFALVIYWLVFYLKQEQWLFPVQRLAKVSKDPLAQFQSSSDRALSSIQSHWLKQDFGNTELWFLPALNKSELEEKDTESNSPEAVAPEENDLDKTNPKSAEPAPTIIIAHGQLGVIDSWAERLSALREQGFNCLLVEFPGYGRSAGQPTAASLKQTFCAAYDWVVAKPEVEPSQIIGLGRSMGGGIIMMLADNRPLCQIWLFSTFTSLTPFFTRRGIPGFVLKDRFDNLKRLASKTVPSLILHGSADDVIPVSHGKALVKVAQQGRLILEPGDHNNCPVNWREFSLQIAEYYASNR